MESAKFDKNLHVNFLHNCAANYWSEAATVEYIADGAFHFFLYKVERF